MDERVAFFKLDAGSDGGHAGNPREQLSVAAMPSRGPAAAPKRQPVAAPKRAAAGGNSGGPVKRMQAALGTAVKSELDWKEF
jgi:hypothetical protein